MGVTNCYIAYLLLVGSASNAVYRDFTRKGCRGVREKILGCEVKH